VWYSALANGEVTVPHQTTL